MASRPIRKTQIVGAEGNFRSFFAPETKSDKPMGTTEDRNSTGNLPGQARRASPPKFGTTARAAASSLAAAVFPRSAGRVFPRSPPFLASCGGCGLPLPRCAGSRFPSLAVFGLAWAAAAVCRSLARCGFPSLAVRRRPPWPWACFFRAQGPRPLPAWPGLADRARLAASALRALRALVAP